MESFFKYLLYVHIASGFVGLIVFWVPIFTKKGSPRHKQLGNLYVRLMWIVVITAIVLAIRNLFTERYNVGIFLAFIALLTASPLWYGTNILANKKEISKSYYRVRLLFDSLLTFSGLCLLAYGIFLKGNEVGLLMIIFGILGLMSFRDVRSGLRKTRPKVNWLKEHLVGMVGSGIASHTAFLVFGASRVLSSVVPDYLMVIPWVAPTIIGVFGMGYAEKKWIRKSSK